LPEFRDQKETFPPETGFPVPLDRISCHEDSFGK
jgi:hypothetical protein